MIPLAAIPWRLIGYATLAAGIIFAGWWLGSRLERANDADRLEQTLAAERQQRAADQEAAARYAYDAAKARASETALQARIAALPKERLVYVPKPIPGQPAVSGCARLSSDFMLNYNAAIEGRTD